MITKYADKLELDPRCDSRPATSIESNKKQEQETHISLSGVSSIN